MLSPETIIAQTKKWIIDVVIGLNFCPFAAREVKRDSIFFEITNTENTKEVLEALAKSFITMDKDEGIETLLLILPTGFEKFSTYLKMLDVSEQLINKLGYEGVYQVASFHPQYLFAGSKENDPANYTNRSPYPMLHILREKSLSRVIDSHPDTLKIPENNIELTRQKGLAQMQLLRSASMHINQS